MRHTKLQAMITSLERALNSAHASFRVTDKEKDSALAKAEAGLQNVAEGRTWSRVREEEALRRQAEAQVAELQRELERATAAMHERSQKVRSAHPSQPLAHATDERPTRRRPAPRETSSSRCARG